MSQKLAFIGAGNIAQAIIGGLVQNGYNPADITAADLMQSQLDKLPAGVLSTTDNLTAVAGADVIVCCVKPNHMAALCQSLGPVLAGQSEKLIISVAAGITVSSINGWAGDQLAVVRCMPNTPALVKTGMTGLHANPYVSSEQKQTTEFLLSAVGDFLWFEQESALDAVTAVSGSGPAYYFLVMEAMIDAAQKLGLTAADAQRLVLQTALGAARMAVENSEPPAILRKNVTSPGGTTEAAIKQLLANGLPEAFEVAMTAARDRSVELSAS
ncbi:MAG: pyrroline-5-carboxylate reductase [Pseudomonadales bacterium]|nr:pyrroline-5-carboxylate reductase [Pseudomonadales bacterium]